MMASIKFIFNGNETIIQCKKKDKMSDICYKFCSKSDLNMENYFFIYGGNQLNLDLSFNEQANMIDKNKNEMSILVYVKGKSIINEGIIKSKEIIYPLCGENCLINIKDYKIRLYECKNSHELNDISLNEYTNTQNINEENIICNNCNIKTKNKSYNKQFFKCLTCKKNLCPLCKSNHDKKHKVIDYDKKDFLCNEHNDFYISYCNDCKKIYVWLASQSIIWLIK